jgi:hypothetical protein
VVFHNQDSLIRQLLETELSSILGHLKVCSMVK